MEGQMTFEFAKRPTIKGFPELRWTGKRPYESTQYYPAQLRERYGEETNGWINKIFWGDNLQVMSHLIKEYRGKIDLIYIDPPFDSKADYKKKIEVKGVGKAETDSTSFEEKQYGDIWTNDEYLQFMYERLLIMRELLSESGSIYVHCDWHKSSFLRIILDEVFGPENFRNEIVWSYFGFKRATSKKFPQKHDLIYSYTKNSDNYTWNVQYRPHSPEYIKRFKKDENGRLYRDDVNPTGGGTRIIYLDEVKGDIIDSVWNDIPPVNPVAKERCDYPTQKPEKLVERIINASTNPGDLVFDCFMGSGTTQAVAMKLGRRFIGADINLGSIQTTTKRLINVANELSEQLQDNEKYTGFEVYNVNNYDFFRNPLEAKELIIQALEIQPFPQSDVWDGELDGRMVKIMPVNRIATKADLEELKANLPYKTYEKRKAENPTQPVEKITIVCMGHEPDLKASLEQELSEYKLDIEIVDILREKKDLQLKREAEAEIVREGNKLVIRAFYPMNLMQKLSLQKEYVEDWRQLVESIMIDWNFDGVVMQPTVTDVPDKKEIVSGVYDIPENAGTIRVKITDLLSESLEVEVE
ncbi:site-specific DNA-methyltransferase [Dorea sp. AM10-31]|uniref:site-specific DNA-methyltransferase n=1 Tax=Dorea sp. AM10-31 TaxID=2293098 RepID=UPI000E3FB35C|nr:site-specific DNA-methyltransferase [Dorea sp. AM10-31]RGF23505.1 site-specific DNA-methyltransferase [Dorea sp. AM10-31]